jgi:RNA-directed DNA polymerase
LIIGEVQARVKQIAVCLRGWIEYFGICTEQVMRELDGLDATVRRRRRAIQLKHRERKRTIVRKLISLGVKARKAWVSN